MKDVFENAAERITFSEAVDFIDQGRVNLIPQHLMDVYIRKGLIVDEAGSVRVTEVGLREHEVALRERFSDG